MSYSDRPAMFGSYSLSYSAQAEGPADFVRAAQTEWIRAPLSVEDCRCWWPLVVDRNRNVPVWSRPKLP
jgi:hypothetical protein